MTASQMRIAETIDAFYGDAGAKDGVSRSYKQAVEDLDAETIKALDGPYRLVDNSCLSVWKLANDDGIGLRFWNLSPDFARTFRILMNVRFPRQCPRATTNS